MTYRRVEIDSHPAMSTSADPAMTELLRQLLERLEHIGENHSEIYDAGVREQMGAAIWNGFVEPLHGFAVPPTFGMFSPEGDRLVREAIQSYVEAAALRAAAIGLSSASERLTAFEHHGIDTSQGENFDDFFWIE